MHTASRQKVRTCSLWKWRHGAFPWRQLHPQLRDTRGVLRSPAALNPWSNKEPRFKTRQCHCLHQSVVPCLSPLLQKWDVPPYSTSFFLPAPYKLRDSLLLSPQHPRPCYTALAVFTQVYSSFRLPVYCSPPFHSCSPTTRFMFSFPPSIWIPIWMLVTILPHAYT